jgi:hypothetical protein
MTSEGALYRVPSLEVSVGLASGFKLGEIEFMLVGRVLEQSLLRNPKPRDRVGSLGS